MSGAIDELYQQLLDQEAAEDGARLRDTLREAVGKNPDQAARRNELSRDLGIPGPEVDGREDELDRRKKLFELNPEGMAEKAPATAESLADPKVAEVAHDDVENMNVIERTFRDIGQSWTHGKHSTRSLHLAAQDAQRALRGLEPDPGIEWQRERLREQMSDQVDYRIPKRGAAGFTWGAPAQVAEQGRMLLETVAASQAAGAVGAGVGAAAGGLSTAGAGALPGAAAGWGTGAGAGAIAFAYEQMFGEFYEGLVELRTDEGEPVIDRYNAAKLSSALAIPAAVLEKTGLNFLLKGIPGFKKLGDSIASEKVVDLLGDALKDPKFRRMLKARMGAEDIAKSGAFEAGTEAGQGALGAAGQVAAALGHGEDLDVIKYQGQDAHGQPVLDENGQPIELSGLQAVLMSVIDQARAGLVVGGGIASARTAMTVATQGDTAQDALARAKLWAGIEDTRALSRLRERDPEAFKAHIRRSIEKGQANDTVYIPKEVVREFFQDDDQVDEESAAVLEQVPAFYQQDDHVDATGVDFQIATEDYLAHVAGTEFGNAIRADIRFGALDPSEREAQDQQAQIAKLSEQVDGIQEAETEEIAVQVIRDTTFRRLLEEFDGRPEVAEAYAELTAIRYKARAKATGKSVKELVDKEGLFAVQPSARRDEDPKLAPTVDSMIRRAEALQRIKEMRKGAPAWATEDRRILRTLARMGGIDPSSELGTLLTELDVPRAGKGSIRGLYQPGGLGSSDQLVASETPLFEQLADQDGYVDQEALFSAIADELRGTPFLTLEEQEGAGIEEQARGEITQALEAAGLTLEDEQVDILNAIAPLDEELEWARPEMEIDENGTVTYQLGPDGFFSKLETEIVSKLGVRGTGAAYLKTIEAWVKKGKVKQEEWEWSGLPEFLAMNAEERLTKDQVVEMLQAGGLHVEVKRLGDPARRTEDPNPDMAVERWEFDDAKRLYRDRLELLADRMIQHYERTPGRFPPFLQAGQLDAPRARIAIDRLIMRYTTFSVDAAVDRGGIQDGLEWVDRHRDLDPEEHVRQIAENSLGEAWVLDVLTPGELAGLVELDLDALVLGMALDSEDAVEGSDDATEFGGYVGTGIQNQENYREVLIKLQNMPTWPGHDAYQGPHWQDDNIVASLLIEEREGALHIIEMQSDWHQAARRKKSDGTRVGYIDAEAVAAEERVNKEARDAFDAAREPKAQEIAARLLATDFEEWEEGVREEAYEDYHGIERTRWIVGSAGTGPRTSASSYVADDADEAARYIALHLSMRDPDMAPFWDAVVESDRRLLKVREGVPDAPFKQTNAWTQLALKVAVREAIAGGRDLVTLTPAAVVTARWGDQLQDYYQDFAPKVMKKLARKLRADFDPGRIDPVALNYNRPGDAEAVETAMRTAHVNIEFGGTMADGMDEWAVWDSSEDLTEPDHYFRTDPDDRSRGDLGRQLPPFDAAVEAIKKVRPLALTQFAMPTIEITEEAKAIVTGQGMELFQQPDGFFSKLEREVANHLGNRGTGAAYLKTLKKWVAKGKVKAEEWEWSGLEQFLELASDQTMTRDQVQEFLKQGGLRVEVRQLDQDSAQRGWDATDLEEAHREAASASSDAASWKHAIGYALAREFPREFEAEFTDHPNWSALIDRAFEPWLDVSEEDLAMDVANFDAAEDDVVINEWMETLQLTLSESEMESMRWVREVGDHNDLANMIRDQVRAVHLNELAMGLEGMSGEYDVAGAPRWKEYMEDELLDQDGDDYREILVTLPDLPEEWRGSHWGAEVPNVVVSLLVEDRTRSVPNDMVSSLFIIEMQSDWHQKARKKKPDGSRVGYRPQITDGKNPQQQATEHRRRWADISAPLIHDEGQRLMDTGFAGVPGRVYSRPSNGGFGRTTEEWVWERPGPREGEETPADRYVGPYSSTNENGDLKTITVTEGQMASTVARWMVESRPEHQETMAQMTMWVDRANEHRDKIPDAPFKKTQAWTQLGLKVALKEAFDRGHDRVVISKPQSLLDRWSGSGTDSAENARKVAEYYRTTVPAEAKKLARKLGGEFSMVLDDPARPLDHVGDYSIGEEAILVVRSNMDGDENALQDSHDVIKQTLPEIDGHEYPRRWESEVLGTIPGGATRVERDRVIRELVAEHAPEFHTATAIEITDELKETLQNDGMELFQPAGRRGPGRAPAGPKGERGSLRLPHSDSLRDALIRFTRARNLSTFLHEAGHLWFFQLAQDAAAEDAPLQLQRDWQTLRDHLGLAEGEEPAERHWELLARSHEAYLMEGRAPTAKLRPLFERFSRWMVRIYKRLTQIPGYDLDLTDEVREVMDRLYASQEEIDAARDERVMEGLFVEADANGQDLTAEQFADWQASAENARAAQTRELERALFVEQERQKTDEWRALRDQTRAEVSEEVLRRQAVRTKYWLQYGELPDGEEIDLLPGKLDKDALVRAKGKAILKVLKSGKFGTWQIDGVHPDVIREAFGFNTIDDLLGAVSAVGNIEDIIDQETDSRMQEEHGRLATSEQMENAVGEVMDNATAIDHMLLEEQMIASTRGGRKSVKSLLRQAAKSHVAATEIRHLRPDKYRAASAREGRKSMEAWKAGDKLGAQDAKRRQVFNTMLEAQARRALDQVDRSVEYVRKLDTSKRLGRIGKAGQNYLDSVLHILSTYEFKKSVSGKRIDRRESLLNWIETQEGLGLDVLVPQSVIDQAHRVSYKKLSVEQFTGVIESLHNIERTARFKTDMILGSERRTKEAVARELATAATTHLDAKKVKQVDRLTDAEKRWSRVWGTVGAFRGIEDLVMLMDGGKHGPWRKYIFERLSKAEADRDRLSKEYLDTFSKLLNEYMKGRHEEYGERVYDVYGIEMSKFGLIMMALNTGSESNWEKMIEGEQRMGNPWTESNIKSLLDRELDQADWEFVQKTWKLTNKLWPMIVAHEQVMNGVAPPKVEGRVVVTPYGEYQGDYFPIAYDPRRMVDAFIREEKSFFDSANEVPTRPMTGQGYNKERTQFRGGLLYDLSALPKHLDTVIHDLTHRAAIIETHALLTDPLVVQALQETLGVEYQRLFVPWLKAIAADRVVESDASEGMAWLLRHARTAGSVFFLGFNQITLATQIGGHATTMDHLREYYSDSPKYLGLGFRKAYGGGSIKSVEEAYQAAVELSNGMEFRIRNRDRDTRDGIRVLTGKGGWVDLPGTDKQVPSKEEVAEFSLRLIGMMQLYSVDLPTWWAAFYAAKEGALKANPGYEHTDAEAAALADAAVRMSQGSGGTKDQVAWMRGPEYQKALTVFYSFMSRMFNMLATTFRQLSGPERNLPNVVARFFLVVSLPMMYQTAIRGNFGPQGDDDDWNDWLLWFLGENVRDTVGTIPHVRAFAGAIANLVDEGGRFSSQDLPIDRMIQAAIRPIRSAVKAFREGSDADVDPLDVATDAATAAALYKKFPARPFIKAIEWALEDENE